MNGRLDESRREMVRHDSDTLEQKDTAAYETNGSISGCHIKLDS